LHWYWDYWEQNLRWKNPHFQKYSHCCCFEEFEAVLLEIVALKIMAAKDNSSCKISTLFKKNHCYSLKKSSYTEIKVLLGAG